MRELVPGLLVAIALTAWAVVDRPDDALTDRQGAPSVSNINPGGTAVLTAAKAMRVFVADLSTCTKRYDDVVAPAIRAELATKHEGDALRAALESDKRLLRLAAFGRNTQVASAAGRRWLRDIETFGRRLERASPGAEEVAAWRDSLEFWEFIGGKVVGMLPGLRKHFAFMKETPPASLERLADAVRHAESFNPIRREGERERETEGR